MIVVATVVLTVAIVIIVAVNFAEKKAYSKVIVVMIVNICFNRFTPSKNLMLLRRKWVTEKGNNEEVFSEEKGQ